MVRCKMICTEKLIRSSQYGVNMPAKESESVMLQAVAGEPNKTWSKYTPSGKIELQINNPAAFEQFKLGQAYFVDFTECPFAELDEQK